jgi:hypothetical protein
MTSRKTGFQPYSKSSNKPIGIGVTNRRIISKSLRLCRRKNVNGESE